jgi:hypothetical protein
MEKPEEEEVTDDMLLELASELERQALRQIIADLRKLTANRDNDWWGGFDQALDEVELRFFGEAD